MFSINWNLMLYLSEFLFFGISSESKKPPILHLFYLHFAYYIRIIHVYIVNQWWDFTPNRKFSTVLACLLYKITLYTVFTLHSEALLPSICVVILHGYFCTMLYLIFLLLSESKLGIFYWFILKTLFYLWIVGHL